MTQRHSDHRGGTVSPARKTVLASLTGLIVLIIIMTAVLMIRAILVKSAPAPVPRVHIEVDADGAARHLSAALRFQTVYETDQGTRTAAFQGLQDYLVKSYPLIHARLVRQKVGGLSLLYEWQGKDPAKAPVILMGHLDVVPVTPGTEKNWTQPPYSGAVSGGFVYGRGALDDKGSVIAILEAVEQLLKEGYQPAPAIYLAFGADEEVGGINGARQIMRTMLARNIRKPAVVLDEGGALVEGRVPGVAGTAAVIGIAEKGYLSLELSVSGPGGHSSSPPVPTLIGRLSAAIAKLEARQFPGRLEAPTLAMLRAIAPSQPYSRRLPLANLWLFGPFVTKALLADPESATMVRTTTAPTVFNAGETENVLPSEARAIINFQILQGETVASVIARVTEVVADTAIRIQPRPGGLTISDPSAVSDASGSAFTAVAKAVRQTIGETPPFIVPFLTGPTDSRYWSEAGAGNVFRFTPFLYEKDWMSRYHGTNERISVQTLADGVRFFEQFIRNTEDL